MQDELPTKEIEFTSVVLDERGAIIGHSTLRAHEFSESLGQSVKLTSVVIPHGYFLMGSAVGQGYADECPRHRVAVSSFLMGKYPVTQEQWQAIMGTNPSRFKGARRPVDNVSWRDAHRFCERLSKRTARTYRLPSEAQWEYACRGGALAQFCCGATLTTDVANYNGEFTYRSEPRGVYRHTTTEVGSFPPNAFGLFDLHGNIWEWCADPWHATYEGAPTDDRVWQFKGEDSYRVARGGCWHDTPDVCRSAARLKLNVHEGDDFVGFRVVLA